MQLFVCKHVCSRWVLIISLQVHRLWISLLIEFSSETDKRNVTKTNYSGIFVLSQLISVHSCHHRLKRNIFILKKTDFGQAIWPAGDQLPLRLRFLTALNTSSVSSRKVFWSKSDSSHFENSPSFQISGWTYSNVFQINEKFIHNCSQASKMWYKLPGAVNI